MKGPNSWLSPLSPSNYDKPLSIDPKSKATYTISQYKVAQPLYCVYHFVHILISLKLKFWWGLLDLLIYLRKPWVFLLLGFFVQIYFVWVQFIGFRVYWH